MICSGKSADPIFTVGLFCAPAELGTRLNARTARPMASARALFMPMPLLAQSPFILAGGDFDGLIFQLLATRKTWRDQAALDSAQAYLGHHREQGHQKRADE